MTSSRAPTLLTLWKATRKGTLTRVPDRPGVVADLGMCGRSLNGNREISWLANRLRYASCSGPHREGEEP